MPDDFLLGLVGSKAEAMEIKQQLTTFLCSQLKLDLSEEKTLITHARDDVARFFGLEIHLYMPITSTTIAVNAVSTAVWASRSLKC